MANTVRLATEAKPGMSGRHTSKTGGCRGLQVISETIRFVVNQGWTTNVELAELGHISDSSVGRYATDESQPDFRTVQLWVRNHPSPRVRQAFADLFLEGTGGAAILPVDVAAADVNGDGRLTCDDALDSAIQAMGDTRDALVEVRAATRDGQVTSGELLSSRSDIQTAIKSLRASMLALETCVDRRQPARPLAIHRNGKH